MALLTREQILDAELSPGKARINRIARRLREHVELSDQDREFLANALEAIVSGDDPKMALGVAGKRAQGRNPMAAKEADAWFQCVVRVEQVRRDDAMKLQDALDHVADERHVAGDSLVRYHKKYRKDAIALLDLVQRELILRGRVNKWLDC